MGSRFARFILKAIATAASISTPVIAANAIVASCVDVDFLKSRPVTSIERGCFISPATGFRQIDYSVTFPGGYPFKGRGLPLAIFLHGRGGTELQFAENRGPQALDDHLRAGGGPFVVVAPREPRHSYWKDGPSHEFGTTQMVRDELGQHVANLSRGGITHPDLVKPALFGISMGAHGALYIAMKDPDKFSQVYALSPVFRLESELLSEDRPAFGSGAEFSLQDPMTLYERNRAGGATCGFPMRDFKIEMGRDDFFLFSTKRTLRFLQSVSADCGPSLVNLNETGGHDSTYWSTVMPRTLAKIGANFDTRSTSSLTGATGRAGIARQRRRIKSCVDAGSSRVRHHRAIRQRSRDRLRRP